MGTRFIALANIFYDMTLGSAGKQQTAAPKPPCFHHICKHHIYGLDMQISPH
jgi:hypothetical protein